MMRYRFLLASILAAAVSACSGEPDMTGPPPVPPPPVALLREIVIPNLPSPYYHFEYDSAGRVTTVSFASELRVYAVTYDGGRIREMSNDAVGNRDRLQYVYDRAGQVDTIRYVDANGLVYTRLVLSYDGPRLAGIVRQRIVDAGIVVDKTMSLSYYPDGNLLEITEHRPALDGQPEMSTVDHFEHYDDKINVDGFSLIHDDFFDHLVLLPGVQLQKGNPGRQTRTGDGFTFDVDYVYAYDGSNRPLSKSGDLTITNGPDAGRKIQIRSDFSYY